MKRGEIWTVAGSGDYDGKPRPVVILQEDRFDATDSVTVCALTSDSTDAPLMRLPIEPNDQNGLHVPSRLMVDKITTIRRARVRARIGRLDDTDLVRLNRAVLVFLGLAQSPQRKRRVSAPEHG
jgi:mRNA interferase MazF